MQIRNQVAEAVHFEHGSGPGILAGLGGPMKREPQVVVYQFAEARGRYAGCEMRGDGGKDIASVKGVAYRMEKILVVGDVPDFGSFMREDDREHAVVRCNEELAGHLG